MRFGKRALIAVTISISGKNFTTTDAQVVNLKILNNHEKTILRNDTSGLLVDFNSRIHFLFNPKIHSQCLSKLKI